MSRIPAVDPTQTEARTHDTLAGIGKALGVLPNLYRVAARSPATLAALVGSSGATAHGTLDAKVREAIPAVRAAKAGS